MLTHSPPVSIVMATLNGGRYLHDQLDSLLAQSYRNWSLIISDDGSTDKTISIARTHRTAGRTRFLNGPKLGFGANFFHALLDVPHGHMAAFCDQDDVWFPDKLQRAVSRLEAINGPALYSAGRVIADADLNTIDIQPRKTSAGFNSLLLRNHAAGHTCVLNAEAVALMRAHIPPPDVTFHDWYCALLVCGAGGHIIHDPEPVLLYRQHDMNVLGSHGGRAKLIASGKYRTWFWNNCSALGLASDALTPTARARVQTLLALRDSHLLQRTATLIRLNARAPMNAALAAMARL